MILHIPTKNDTLVLTKEFRLFLDREYEVKKLLPAEDLKQEPVFDNYYKDGKEPNPNKGFYIILPIGTKIKLKWLHVDTTNRYECRILIKSGTIFKKQYEPSRFSIDLLNGLEYEIEDPETSKVKPKVQYLYWEWCYLSRNRNSRHATDYIIGECIDSDELKVEIDHICKENKQPYSVCCIARQTIEFEAVPIESTRHGIKVTGVETRIKDISYTLLNKTKDIIIAPNLKTVDSIRTKALEYYKKLKHVN